MRCPCLSGDSYEQCCGRFHRGDTPAPTAEALMRSRFTAYALGLPRYLLDTWHESTRPARLDLDESLRWYRLDIISTSGGAFAEDAVVEFVAHYRSGTAGGQQHEVSRFVRENRQWCYLDAV